MKSKKLANSLFVAICLIFSSFLSNNIAYLSFLAFLSIGFGVLYSGLRLSHVQKPLVGMIPFFVLVPVTWILLVGSPPDMTYGSGEQGAINYSAIVVSRFIVILISFLQFSKLVLENGIIYSLRDLGVTGRVGTLLAASFSLFLELNKQLSVSYEAMLVRGIVKRYSVVSRIKAVPLLIRSVLIPGITISLRRSDLWEERELITTNLYPDSKSGIFHKLNIWAFTALILPLFSIFLEI